MKSAKQLVYHSPLSANKILQNFNNARKAGVLCDTTFVSQDREFSVHRAFLSIASKYFKDVFAGAEEDKIDIDDINSEDLELILTYFYTGEITVPLTQATSILRACKTCGLDDLAEACESFLEKNFQEEDIFELRAFAIQGEHWGLCNKIDVYLKDNFNRLYQTKDFLLLPRLQITLIASRNCSNQEFDHLPSLFEKVLAWVQKRQKDHGEKLSSLLEESNMLYLQSNQLLKDCAFDDIEEHLDFNSNEDIKKFRRQTSRCKTEVFSSESGDAGSKRRISNNNNEYKLIVEVQNSDQNAIGLAVVDGQLIAIAMHYKTRHGSSNASTVSSDSSGCEDNILNNSLTMLAPMATGRCSAGIALFDKKLYVIGGYNRGRCLESCEYYDPEVNEWTHLPPLGIQRARLQSVTVGNKIFAAGGSDGHEDLSSTEVYDTASHDWEAGEEMIDRRASFGMDAIRDRIYAVGGVSDSKSLRTAECYDAAVKRWTRIPHMTTSRENVCAVAYQDRIYAIGGTDGWKCHSSVEVYYPEEGTWNEVASMSGPRRGAASAVLNGKIIVAGGSDGKTSLNTVESYDCETNTWTQLPSMTSCRNNASMVVVESVPYVIGGFGGYSGTEFLNTVEYLEPVSNEWKVYIHG